MEEPTQQNLPSKGSTDNLPKSQRWAMTLRLRLLLLVLFSILPAMLMLFETNYEQRRHQEHDAQQSVVQFSRYAVEHHESLIVETQRLLSLVQEVEELQNGDSEECRQLLEKLLFGNAAYANFGIIRPDGTIACSAVPQVHPTNLSDRTYFKAAISSKQLTIGEYQIGRIVQRPVQIIAQPILTAQQQVLSVAYAALNLEWFKNLIPLSALPPDSSITVMDRNGIILSRHPNPQGGWTGVNLINQLRLTAGLKENRRAEWLTEAEGVDNVRRIYAINRLGSATQHYGYIAVGVPTAPLDAAIKQELLRGSTILAVTFIAVVLFAWFSSESLILKRTRALTLATRQLSNGDLTARAMITGNDEFSHLAGEFNHMAESMQTEYHQIERLNRIHAVLSSINGAILRIRDRDTLLDEACRIAVEHGALRLARIVLVDTSTGEVQNVAWHGEGADYINGICHRHNGDIKIPLPCNRVLVNDQPVIHNDIENARTDIVWKNFAMEHGFRSMAAFPLRQEGKVIGILALYSNELNFFSQQESELFMEVAADTALGLEYINKDQHMAHALYHDILTGLPNRRLLEERLQQDILRANHHDRHIGVTIINITGFRRLAGIYGSSIADKTLTFIANHLLQKVRDGDTIAHLEGDEFAILFNDVGSVNDIITTATNLITEMPAVVNCAEHEVHFHMHAGIAIYPNDGEDYSSLIRNATLACATRKMAGAHSINFYSPGIQQQAQRRELIEKGLRSAIEREDELELHYQPVVDIHSHQIVSVEALARWHSKELGAISPVSFIPVAEESGLILPLGQWALASACKQIEAWRNLGIDNIKIAVNVSFVQLRDKHFITQLSEHIANIGQHSAHQLSIEITESELMDNIDATITQMNAIKGLGIACYLDDFGTGYSSLSHLHNLPLDVIKIDQSFIRSLGKNDSSTSIVKMIITLAQNLNLKTIAEGVETTEQLSLLQQFGCNFVQGYLFSKPKAANEITLLLQEGKPLLKQPLA